MGMVGVGFFTQGDISEVRIGPSGTEGKSETVNENRGCVFFEIFMVFSTISCWMWPRLGSSHAFLP